MTDDHDEIEQAFKFGERMGEVASGLPLEPAAAELMADAILRELWPALGLGAWLLDRAAAVRFTYAT